MINRETYINTPFLRKLNHILNDPQYHEIIRWDQTGTMIDIVDQAKIESEILPRYFRHSKFQSFVRQLNLYGFRKMKKKNCHRFRHADLVKGSSLFSIKSKRKFKNCVPKQTFLRDQVINVEQSLSQEEPDQNENKNSLSEQKQNDNNCQSSLKFENNSFNLISFPFGFQTEMQSPMYMGMLNSYGLPNPIQNSYGQVLYFPNVNNLLFYN